MARASSGAPQLREVRLPSAARERRLQVVRVHSPGVAVKPRIPVERVTSPERLRYLSMRSGQRSLHRDADDRAVFVGVLVAAAVIALVSALYAGCGVRPL